MNSYLAASLARAKALSARLEPLTSLDAAHTLRTFPSRGLSKVGNGSFKGPLQHLLVPLEYDVFKGVMMSFRVL